ncbi:dihydroflavonol-4-reductase [Xanthomonas sp. JAI131]|uniref:NAD-dependent epimerase/dehydratase family protein n=1 Tax=Xanthomonas sp. JAI131 TaxID=2723067 RepID=UPI0015C7E2B4|nr:NAD-dependent epimerase/dehydratase family protein [Xanthomonas sp. JAI131]NYF19084.1 dihydroflavonol-4-reductase [Xanthomonas sp. JAI131]
MTVFVTGGNGFVGLNIVSALVSAGHRVTAMVRSDSNTKYLEPFGVDIVRGGLDDVDALSQAMRGAEAVIHAAGNTSCKWSDLPMLQAANVHSTRNVVDAALRNGVRRLVYTSTTSTVGAFDDASRVADESVPLTGYRRRSPYAATKQQAERVVFEANARGLETIVLNPAEVVGAYDHNLQWGRLLIAAHYDQLPFSPPGGATYCSAAEVGRAHVSALSLGRPGERYLLGGENIRIARFLNVIGEVLEKPLRIPKANYRWLRLKTTLQERRFPFVPGQPAVEAYRMRVMGCTYYFDSSKAERELGYRSAPIEAMVRDSAEWYRRNGFFG